MFMHSKMSCKVNQNAIFLALNLKKKKKKKKKTLLFLTAFAS